MMERLKISFIGGYVRDIPPDSLGNPAHQLVLQDRRDRSGDFVLHGEYVGKLPVVTFGPQMKSVGRSYELRGNPYSVAAFANASFKNVFHAQLARDLRDLRVLAFKGERRSPGRHFESRNLRQGVDDLFRQTVAEVILLFVAAHVGEG